VKDATFERLGALSGLSFVVLAVLSGFLYPQQPRVDSTPATTLAWVTDHRVALQTGMICDFFAAGVLVWFVAYLHRVLRRGEDGTESLAPIVFGAGLGVAITTALAALPTAVLAFMVAQPGGIDDPSLVRMLGDLNTLFFSVTSVMTGVFLLGLGLAMLGRAVATRWIGWLCLVVAAFNGLAVWIGVTFSSYHGKGWMVVGWGAYIGFLVVMLLVSASLLRHAHAARAVAPSVAVS
jgi:Domain of unknown function (DUF4386)